MQYFKHHANMRHDIRIKRTISKYGLEGYGLYCLILESITESLSTGSPIPSLQETSEDIAEFYNGNTARIDEIVNYMIGQDLFTLDEINGAILCHKLYKFLDTSQTRSEELRNMIKAYKIKNCYPSQTVSDKSERKEENKKRIEEEKNNNIGGKKTTRFKKPTIEEVTAYCQERKNTVEAEKFVDYYISKDWMIGKNRMKDWKAAVRNWERSAFNTPNKVDQYNVTEEHAF